MVVITSYRAGARQIQRVFKDHRNFGLLSIIQKSPFLIERKPEISDLINKFENKLSSQNENNITNKTKQEIEKEILEAKLKQIEANENETNFVPPPTELESIKHNQQIELPDANKKSVSKEIVNDEDDEALKITSSLYTPQNPFLVESKRHLIEEKIKQIEERIKVQEEKERQKLILLEQEEEKLYQPKLGDFKRPMATTFLIASAVYLLIQYSWWLLKDEEYIMEKEAEIREKERIIQMLLNQQAEIVEEMENKPSLFSSSPASNSGYFSWLWRK
ncbi:hypothetical protein B5S28_g884 [[Candida] boidinii]|nr:hypothetical protein B5S28_g884 [[Candida] boidinii]OWB60139.1 hypothetical protein B5S29_g1007 [[Candida] boidinii]OWB76975.1 hypothetical protein B5S32_g1132 [[Candida] boidinii]GMF05589.1 unnamed protein product [[Candida] boidinii]